MKQDIGASSVSHSFLSSEFPPVACIRCRMPQERVAGKHAEQVGYLLLRHPHGYGRHRDRTRFTDCYYTSVHNRVI